MQNIKWFVLVVAAIVSGWLLLRDYVPPEPSSPDNTQNGGIGVNPPENPQVGECYIGGCSSQICSDQPDMVSTCEFRAEYACYRTARCERQASGECGWTETEELQMCLANPPQL